MQGLEPKYNIIFILPFIYIYQIFKFIKQLKEFKPHLIHINTSFKWAPMMRDLIFLNIAKKNDFPVIFFIHGWEREFGYKIKNNIISKSIIKNNLKKADVIIVLAKHFKDELVSLGIQKENIFISSTMINSDIYIPSGKSFNRPYNVLFCANIIREKGPYELLDAIPIVINDFPDTRFIFLGDGKEIENLKKKSIEKGIVKNVEFKGYKTGTEKIRLFKEAHIFILPSYSEGFPTVVLEAMAAGLSLLVTPMGRLSEIIKDDIHGFIIKTMPPDPKEIADKMIYLLKNPKLLKKISETNINEVKKNYDVKLIIAQISEIYQKILKN